MGDAGWRAIPAGLTGDAEMLSCWIVPEESRRLAVGFFFFSLFFRLVVIGVVYSGRFITTLVHSLLISYHTPPRGLLSLIQKQEGGRPAAARINSARQGSSTLSGGQLVRSHTGPGGKSTVHLQYWQWSTPCAMMRLSIPYLDPFLLIDQLDSAWSILGGVGGCLGADT